MINHESSNNIESEVIPVANTSIIRIDGRNIVTMNYDEQKKDNLELKKANLELNKDNVELKKDNEKLKEDLESANRRNMLLQNYLVAIDERIGQTIFIEKVHKNRIYSQHKSIVTFKDGGRLYRGGVFLNENQCAVLDKSKSDNEFLNNLVSAIFGRKVLETSSITGVPSNRMKGKSCAESSSDASVLAPINNPKQKLKLDPELLQLTYGKTYFFKY